MTRTLTILTTLTVAGAAHAHPGHLAPAAGHSHWELLAGLAVIAIAGFGAWKALSRR